MTQLILVLTLKQFIQIFSDGGLAFDKLCTPNVDCQEGEVLVSLVCETVLAQRESVGLSGAGRGGVGRGNRCHELLCDPMLAG